MKFSVIAASLQLLAVSLAYSVTEGTVKLGGKTISYGEVNTQEVKQLSIESPKDKIEVNLKLSDDIETKPHQLAVVVSSAKDSSLAAHFVPTFSVSNDVKISIPTIKLPEVLKVQDKLVLTLIAGDLANQLYYNLGEIVPSAEFKELAKYTPKPRLGLKPEIRHTFREDPATVNPTIPIAFIGAAIVLAFGLVGSWVTFIGSDLTATFESVTPTQLTYNISFLLSLVGFEINFVRYYLSQSIFTTLFNAFFLGLASIFFGSKVLRSLRENRRVGKF